MLNAKPGRETSPLRKRMGRLEETDAGAVTAMPPSISAPHDLPSFTGRLKGRSGLCETQQRCWLPQGIAGAEGTRNTVCNGLPGQHGWWPFGECWCPEGPLEATFPCEGCVPGHAAAFAQARRAITNTPAIHRFFIAEAARTTSFARRWPPCLWLGSQHGEGLASAALAAGSGAILVV